MQSFERPRILTGHRTTGPRHIGHLAGTLTNWTALQDSYECFFLLADLHVLTTDFEHTGGIRSNTLEVLTDWLAAGIDPQRSTIILQSAVPEHAQLSLLLSMLVTEARLHRVPTYKEQINNLHIQPSLGLLTYPVLQAADILLYKAQAVPVGEDQLPHIELTREIARRYNQLYGQTFAEPDALLSNTPRLPGLDNRTMHSSYGNTILLRDTPEETQRKIMSMYTDPARIHASDPGHIENNPLFTYLDLYYPHPNELAEMKTRYRAGSIGDVELKQILAASLNAYLKPIREKRAELAPQTSYLRDILLQGSQRARHIARETLEEVLDAMGLSLGLSMRSEQSTQTIPSGAFC